MLPNCSNDLTQTNIVKLLQSLFTVKTVTIKLCLLFFESRDNNDISRSQYYDLMLLHLCWAIRLSDNASVREYASDLCKLL